MRFTVGKKIGAGFSIVVILLLVVFFITYVQVNNAKSTNNKFLTVDQPSSFAINHLKNELSTTHNHMQKWVNDESIPNEPFKIEAEKMLDINLYSDIISLDTLSKKWKSEAGGKEELIKIKESLNELILLYNSGVRFILTDIESYSDDRIFIAQSTFELEISPLYETRFSAIG